MTPMVRPERPDDAVFLRDLFSAEAGELLRRAGLPEDAVTHLVGAQLRSRDASYRARYPDARFGVVECADERVGRIVTDAAEGALRIVDVALLPDWRGRGIGTRLLRSLQAEAKSASVPLRLSVARGNAGAHRLYARLGFRAVEVTEAHVGLQWTS